MLMKISGAMPTLFVSDMDKAVRFYTTTLGFKLKERYGDHWASIDCGDGVTLGLHPASATDPSSRAGTTAIGFRATGTIHEAVDELKAGGVALRGDVLDDKEVRLVNFTDPDGHPLYVTEVRSKER
jgi:catechol 2,3-dioxygenase-like lactoylglutathione lyase family enzyme